MGYTWEQLHSSYSLKMARMWQWAGGDAGTDGAGYGAVRLYRFHLKNGSKKSQMLICIDIIRVLCLNGESVFRHGSCLTTRK